jgi:hypothetical protein
METAKTNGAGGKAVLVGLGLSVCLLAEPLALFAAPRRVIDVRQIGAVSDPSCHRDNTAAFRAAFATDAGGQIYVPAGTYCLNTAQSTLVITAGGTTLYGDGRASIIKWNAPAGTPIAPILDVKAQNVTIHDLAFDHNNRTIRYRDNAYFGNAQPWGDVAVVVQGAPTLPPPDNIKLFNLFITSGFDNCLGIGAIEPAGWAAVAGRPSGVVVDNIRTANCGVGVHAGGVHGGNPGRIGFGIDNGGGVNVVISNSVDVRSYDGFGDDIGAGARTTFHHIASYSASLDRNNPKNGSGLGLYVGSALNNIDDVAIYNPQGDAIWVDYYAWPVRMTNIRVKGSAGNCLHLKSGATISGLTCEDTGMSAENQFDDVWIDASAGPMPGPVTIKRLDARGSRHAATVAVTGRYKVTGDIEAQSLAGGAAATNITAESRDSLSVHTHAN